MQPVFAVVLAVCALAAGAGAAGGAATQPLQVFILAHSHDDVGWVRTPDAYYDDFVRDIYTTAVSSLLENSERRFQSVEMAYFSRWYAEQTPKLQQAVQELVTEGRLAFAVGGWVMPDEGTTDAADLLETMTLGHQWLFSTLGTKVRYGFQVDPFGASTPMALLSAQLGFYGHVISRVNFWEKNEREATQTLEFEWSPSSSQKDTTILTHLMDSYSYSSPSIPRELQQQYLCAAGDSSCPGGGFLWDGGDQWPANYWQKRVERYGYASYPEVNATNVRFYADYLVNNSRARAQWFRSPNLLWPFGSDFQHFNATRMFTSMDAIIAEIAAHNGTGDRYEGVSVRYGQLSDYFNAIEQAGAGPSWGTRGAQDFLPYTTGNVVDGLASNVRTWSGYFASHESLKGEARAAGRLLRAADRMLTVAEITSGSASSDNIDTAALSLLRRAVAVLQHHDAITGTMGPGSTTNLNTTGNIGAVHADYSTRLSRGVSTAMPAVQSALATLMRPTDDANGDGGSSNRDDGGWIAPGGDVPSPLPSLNSSAEAAVQSLRAGSDVPVVVYNPLAWKMASWQSLLVPGPAFRAVNAYGKPYAKQQVNPEQPSSLDGTGAGLWRLWVRLTLPPLGHTTMLVQRTPKGASATPRGTVRKGRDSSGQLTNGFYTLNFNRTTGTVMSALPRAVPELKSTQLKLELLEYPDSMSSVWSGGRSGSYIFNPTGPAATVGGAYATPNVTVISGPFVSELRQQLSPAHAVRVRLLGGPGERSSFAGGFVDLQYRVGPLGGSVDAIMRVSSGLNSSSALPGVTSQFASDDNGLQTQPRLYNASRSLIFDATGARKAANYVPFVRWLHLQDDKADRRLALLSERAHGATSCESGQLEAILHRRLLRDDALGACFAPSRGQSYYGDCPPPMVPHNLTTVVQPRLWLLLASRSNATVMQRQLSLLLNNPAVMLFGQPQASQSGAQWMTSYGATVSPLMRSLPANVHLLTLQSQPSDNTGIRMRLQHIYEDVDSALLPALARKASFDMGSIFNWTFTGMQPTTLNFIDTLPMPSDGLVTDVDHVSLQPQQIAAYLSDVKPLSTEHPLPLWAVVTIASAALLVVVALGYFLCRRTPTPTHAALPDDGVDYYGGLN